MKLILSLILSFCTLLSLSACKSNSSTDLKTSKIDSVIDSTVTTDNEKLSWDGSTLTISKEKFMDGAKLVQLTKENWNTYFKDYSVEFEKKIQKNDFGDIEKEYYIAKGDYFGANKEYIILYNPEKVSFKFDGVTESNAEYISNTSQDIPDLKVTPKDYKKEKKHEKEYYIAGLDAIGYTYTEHKLLDVIGTIIVIDIPELKKYTEFEQMNLPIPTCVSFFDTKERFILNYDECLKILEKNK